MAINPVYEHSTVMSKVNVNGSIYWVKDADLRTIVSGFGDSVYKDVADQIAKGDVNLPTSGQVAQAIEDAVKDLEGAMHFRGIVEKEDGETDAQALARAIATPKAGDVAIIKDNGKEYIYNGSAWEEVGDQNIYLTKAEAEANYVKKTVTVAGKALNHNITVAELSGSDALNLKSLSHKDSATGTLSTIDSGTVDAAKPGEYNVSAQTASVPKTFDALDVTPAGTVAVTLNTGAAVSYNETKSVSVSGLTAAEGQSPNYTPAGSVSAPNINASLDLKEDSVATVTNAGTSYSLTDGAVDQAADTTSAFAKKTMKAVINATDTEQLDILYVANTDSEFYGNAVTASGEVSYTKPVLSGALPTFGTKDVVIKTNSTVSASLAAAPVFTGAGAVLSAEPHNDATDATVTDASYNGGFTGTAASVTPTIASREDISVTQGKVTVAEDTFDLAFTSTPKTITVE